MKSLNEFLNESATNTSVWKPGSTGSEITDHVDVLAVDILSKDQKKFGVVSYDVNSGGVLLMTFDSKEDLQDAYGYDVDDLPELEKMKVGDSSEFNGTYYMKLW